MKSEEFAAALIVNTGRKFFTLHLILHLFQLRPTVGRPADGTLDEHGSTVLGGTVAVAYEDVLAVEGIGGTVARGLPLLLVPFYEQNTEGTLSVATLFESGKAER